MRFGIGKKLGPFRAGFSVGRNGIGWGAGVGPVHFTDGRRGGATSSNSIVSDNDKVLVSEEELARWNYYERMRLERERDVFGGLKRSRFKSSGFCPNCSELVSMGSLTCFNCGAIVGTQILIDRDDPPSGSRSIFEKVRFESELEALRKEVQVIGDIRTHQEHRNKSALQAAGRARIKQKMDARKRIRKLEARKTSRFWISLATAKKFFKVVLRVTVWCSLVYALYAWVTYLFF